MEDQREIECYGGPLDGAIRGVPGQATEGCVVIYTAEEYDGATGVMLRKTLTRYRFESGRLTYMRPTVG